MPDSVIDKMSDDLRDIIKIISFLIIILGGLVLMACNGNYYVGNLQVTPSDSLYHDYMIITDQDSIKHWFVRTTVDGGILVGDNYCYKHNIWENVQKKGK